MSTPIKALAVPRTSDQRELRKWRESTEWWLKNTVSHSVRPEWWGAGTGTDDTNAFVEACAYAGDWTGGVVELQNGKTYNIDTSSGTIPFKCSLVCNEGLATIVNSDTTNFAFSAIRDESTAEVDAQWLRVSGIKLQSKYGISFNTAESGIVAGFGEGEILGFVVERNYFLGDYDSGDDVNYATATAVTQATLKGFGVGIRISKAFNYKIENNKFRQFGMGVFSIGSDIGSISHNRIYICGRWIHLLRSGTYGSQTRIEHNDLLACARVGGIWCDAWFTTITDNYFENGDAYKSSGTYITTSNDIGTNIIGNRFDGINVSTPPMLKLEPRYGMLLKNNRYNPSATIPIVDIDCSTNWTGSNQQLTGPMAVWKDQMIEFPVPSDSPWIQYGPNNPLFFNFQNAINLSGAGPTAEFPWEYNSGTDVWEIQQNTANTIIYFDLQQTANSYKMAVKGLKVSGTGAIVVYHQYEYDGSPTTIYNGKLYFRNTSDYEDKNLFLQIPTGAGPSTLSVELVNTEVAYVSVGLCPLTGSGPHMETVVYDFSVGGGAIGGHEIVPIPANTTIIGARYEVLTAFTSGGSATVGIGIVNLSPGAIVAVSAYDNAVYSVGHHDSSINWAAAGFVSNDGTNRAIGITVAAAALTAGKVAIHYEFILDQ